MLGWRFLISDEHLYVSLFLLGSVSTTVSVLHFAFECEAVCTRYCVHRWVVINVIRIAYEQLGAFTVWVCATETIVYTFQPSTKGRHYDVFHNPY